jgi:hypothetical protein
MLKCILSNLVVSDISFFFHLPLLTIVVLREPCHYDFVTLMFEGINVALFSLVA